MGTEVAIKGKNDIDVIKNRIYEVRGQRVMLDRDKNVMIQPHFQGVEFDPITRKAS